MAFFLASALLCYRTERFRGATYTMVMMTLVAMALFFPWPFQRVGSLELKTLIVPLLQGIMFTVGSQMGLKDFEGVLRMPRMVVIGLTAHFVIMPLLGYSLARLFPLATPEIAAGVILIGCAPCGMASNVMCFLAKANLALSVTLTACATLVAPVLMPFWMKTLAGQMVPVDFWGMMAEIIKIVIYPIMAGITFHLASSGQGFRRAGLQQTGIFAGVLILVQVVLTLARGKPIDPVTIASLLGLALVLPLLAGAVLGHLLDGNKQKISSVMALFSMTGLGVILTIITAAGRDNLLTIGLWLLVACLCHNIGGYTLGYWTARLFRMDERSCRTIAIEIGQQNGGLASGIAMQMGQVATLGLAPAIFGALQNVTGSALATWWRQRPTGNEDVDTNATR
ncbi:bile acid:sodium symporter [Opitutus sp. ER46]|nr:bile acid:sodium symporter [Opitutus sp. ER46]